MFKTKSNNPQMMADILSTDIGVGYIYFDPKGDLSRVSDTFKEIAGFAGDDLPLGLNIFKFAELSLRKADLPQQIASKISKSLHDKYVKYAAKGIEHREEEIFLMGDGKHVKAIHHYMDSGALLIAIEDVTADEKDRNLFRMGLELGSSGFWSLDFETGEFQFSDYISERLTQTELERIHAKGLFAIIHPDDLPNIMDVWGKALASDEKVEFTFRVVLEKHGEMYLRNVGATQIDQNGKKIGFTAFVTDITDDIKMRRELDAVKDASEAKGRFLAQISHEIKTPLNAIIGMSDALLDDSLPEETKESLKYILRSAEGLDGLLSNTLDHARMNAQDNKAYYEDVSLKDILRHMVHSWTAKAKENSVKLDLRLSPNLPDTLKLDEDRVKQTLHNLISNAIKFSSGGHVIVGATLKDDALCLVVKDDGIGMDKASLATLFEPYVQGDNTIKRRFGGTGLGMSIVKQLLDIMDAKIKVHSKPGKGTAFVVSLPLNVKTSPKAERITREASQISENPTPAASPPPPAPAPADEPLAPVSQVTVTAAQLDLDAKDLFTGLRVLCVEDNPVNQTLVKKLLEKSIGALTFANNGQEALDILHTQAFDVILMDIHMPVKDGIETTIAIRNSEKDWADVVIIALTADPDYQQLRICRNIGMDGTLGKPVKRREIMQVIEDVLLSSDRSNESEVAA